MVSIAIKQGDSTSKRCDQLIKELNCSRKVYLSHHDHSVQKLVAVVEIVKATLAESDIKIYQYNRLSNQMATDSAKIGAKRPLESRDKSDEPTPGTEFVKLNKSNESNKKEVQLSVILSLDKIKMQDDWTEQ